MFAMALLPDLPLFTILLLLTACLLSLCAILQVAAVYLHAYMAAPSEITTFIDAVHFSIQENESYDRDVGKVQRLEDKLRLGKLLRDIQKCGDDLREDLNALLIDEGGTTMRSSMRLIWATKKTRLEGRMRRLDLLRMRFLVVFMGLVASNRTASEHTMEDPEKPAAPQTPPTCPPPKQFQRPSMPHFLSDAILNRPPLRKLSTRPEARAGQSMGHTDKAGSSSPQRSGWAGVVHELQNSPLMHKRHASIESSIGSPLDRSPRCPR